MRVFAAGCFVTLLATSFLAGANTQPAREKPGPKDMAAYEQAYKEGLRRFQEACRTAGKSMPAQTERVPGVRLEVAPEALSFERGSLDPQWPFAGMPRERMGEKFIASFLDFTFTDNDLHPEAKTRTGMTVTMSGFPAIDVLQKDRTYLRYRLKGKAPHEGMAAEPVARPFRHVVRIEPLEIAGGRAHWVAGTRMRVIDGDTGRVIGELRAVSFALPPQGVFASELDRRSWTQSMSCPKHLDIQTAMARTSLIGIVDPPRYGAPSPSEQSLAAAVQKGFVREATWADIDAWQSNPAVRDRYAGKFRPARGLEPAGAYVVLKAFEFPPGLYGAHSARFYVPKGVPRPTGDPGHSSIFDFNTMQCDGIPAQCGPM